MSNDKAAKTDQVAQLREAAKALEAREKAGQAVMNAGLPDDITVALLLSGDADMTARIAHAKNVSELCELAGEPGLALSYVERHIPIAEVRDELVNRKAARTQDINVTLPTNGGARGLADRIASLVK